jgi:hypothetical protein
MEIGGLQHDLGLAKEAVASFESACGLWQALAKEDEVNRAEYQENLARVLGDLGNAHLGRQDRRRAEDRQQQAHDLWRGLLSREPDNPRYHHGLGATLQNLGAASGDPRRVAELLREAIAHQERAVAASPGAAEYRVFLKLHHTTMVHVQLSLGRPSAAAVSLLRNRELSAGDAAALYEVASGLASCVAALGRGPEAQTARAEAERRRLTGEAIEALREAVRHGFKDADRLRDDPALAPLRGAEAFRRLLVEAGVKGGG